MAQPSTCGKGRLLSGFYFPNSDMPHLANQTHLRSRLENRPPSQCERVGVSDTPTLPGPPLPASPKGCPKGHAERKVPCGDAALGDWPFTNSSRARWGPAGGIASPLSPSLFLPFLLLSPTSPLHLPSLPHLLSSLTRKDQQAVLKKGGQTSGRAFLFPRDKPGILLGLGPWGLDARSGA